MTSIYAYQKVSTPHTTIELTLPSAPGSPAEQHCTELCTIAGITYVAVPAGVVLPDQPPELSVSVVTLTPELREAIKLASPHVQLINTRVCAAIAERYTYADEIKLLRTAPSSEMNEYNAYAEECRAWGRAQKAKLGL